MSETPRETRSSTSTTAPLPPHLEEALIELLAQALVAELVDSANLLKSPAEPTTTVVSPPGPDRSAQEVRDLAA